MNRVLLASLRLKGGCSNERGAYFEYLIGKGKVNWIEIKYSKGKKLMRGWRSMGGTCWGDCKVSKLGWVGIGNQQM